MDRQLIKRFEDYFAMMDSPVKDEEILIFLDKSYQNKFDRKIFNEIKDQITSSQGKSLTPRNFAQTYYTAYKQLRTSEEQARREIESLRLMRNAISGGARGSRHQNFSGYGIGDSETQPKYSGGTFENQNSIQISNVIGNELDINETETEGLILVEFDPINFHEFSLEYLNDHSIQTVFGNEYIFS